MGLVPGLKICGDGFVMILKIDVNLLQITAGHVVVERPLEVKESGVERVESIIFFTLPVDPVGDVMDQRLIVRVEEFVDPIRLEIVKYV